MHFPHRSSSKASTTSQASANSASTTLHRTSSVRYPQGRPQTTTSATLAGADLYGLGVHPDGDAQSTSMSRAHEAAATTGPPLRRTNEIRRPRGYTHSTARSTRQGSQTSHAAIYEHGRGREGEILAQQYSRSFPDETPGEPVAFEGGRKQSLRKRIGESIRRSGSRLARGLSGRSRRERGAENGDGIANEEGEQEQGSEAEQEPLMEPETQPEPDLSRNESHSSRTAASASERFRTYTLAREEEREARYHTGEPLPAGPDLSRNYGPSPISPISPINFSRPNTGASGRDRDPYQPRDRTETQNQPATRTRANTNVTRPATPALGAISTDDGPRSFTRKEILAGIQADKDRLEKAHQERMVNVRETVAKKRVERERVEREQAAAEKAARKAARQEKRERETPGEDQSRNEEFAEYRGYQRLLDREAR